MRSWCGKMNDTIRLILTGLACYRLAQLISLDTGPYGIFNRFRVFLEQRESEIGQEINKAVSCPFCLGMWLSLILIPLVIYPTYIGDLFILWFGLAGFQTVLQEQSK